MPVVSVASFNIHWGLDRRGAPFDLRAALARLDADVVFVQESFVPHTGAGAVEVAAGDRWSVTHVPLAGGRPGRIPKAVPPGRRSGGTWGLSVLARRPLAPPRVAALGRSFRDPARRAAVVTELAGLTLVGTHMSHISQGSPRQVRRLRRVLPPASTPAVLAGDMNMWPSLLAALLPAGWTPAVTGRTWPAGGVLPPLVQIDHLLVTAAVTVRSSEVVPVGRSDHLPVRAELEL